MRKIIMVSGAALLLFGYFNSSDTESVNNAKLGKEVFDKNCASCHGVAASGLTKNWKQTLPNGKFPAPPLNGTAHAWHHSPKTLMKTVNYGGIKFGGWMPGFEDKLSEEEKQAVLDYIYSLWPDGIKEKYDSRFK